MTVDAHDDQSGDPLWLHGPLRVVVNEEEQYSVWPLDRDLPAGWSDVGVQGSKRECLAYIETVWTDMRPLSLRRQMESQ
jgi:MbtH protein